MVHLDGTWQPADRSDVVVAWIHSGQVGPATSIRHSSWTSARRADEIQQFASHFRHAARALSTSSGMPRVETPRGTKIAFAVIAAMLFGVGVTYVVGRSAHVGVLLGFLVVLVAVGLVLSRMDWAPSWLRTISAVLLKRRAWTFAIIALLLVGTLAGLNIRGERISACEGATAHAETAKRAGRPAAEVKAAYDAAAAACGVADMAEEKRRASEGAAAAEQVIDAERKAAFDAAVSEARRMASTADGAAGSVAKFEEARRFGALSAEDAVLFGAQLVAHSKVLAGGGKHEEALTALHTAQQVAPSTPDLPGLLDAQTKAVRRMQIESAIAAATTVQRSRTLCDTPLEVKKAWSRLQTVRRGEPLYKEAVKVTTGLERCRKAMIRTMAAGLRDIAKKQRLAWADKYETKLLDEGLDVRVRVSGQRKDRLTITYVLFNRAWAHKITDGGSMNQGAFLPTLQELGFRRVTFADGFMESFFYDLEPVSEETLAANATGLPQPLTLE